MTGVGDPKFVEVAKDAPKVRGCQIRLRGRELSMLQEIKRKYVFCQSKQFDRKCLLSSFPVRDQDQFMGTSNRDSHQNFIFVAGFRA